LEPLVSQGDICSDIRRSVFQIVGWKDCHDGCDLFESSPHGFKPTVKKGGDGRLIGRTKGGMNTKLHAVTDAQGRPIRLHVTAGQISDYTGAAALIEALPKVDWLLADRGYDADWFRKRLKDKEIKPCIPGRKNRKKPIKYDKRRYKRRNRIEIMFGRLKDWRRIATRYDRCPVVFRAAIDLAAAVIFWLGKQ
jgi:transposase